MEATASTGRTPASPPHLSSVPGHLQHGVGDLRKETFRDTDTQRETKRDTERGKEGVTDVGTVWESKSETAGENV